MPTKPGYLQAAFSTEAVENGELPMLRMMADKRLFVQRAGPNMGLMIDQRCLR